MNKKGIGKMLKFDTSFTPDSKSERSFANERTERPFGRTLRL